MHSEYRPGPCAKQTTANNKELLRHTIIRVRLRAPSRQKSNYNEYERSSYEYGTDFLAISRGHELLLAAGTHVHSFEAAARAPKFVVDMARMVSISTHTNTRLPFPYLFVLYCLVGY
jgi:hypothetical protein